MMYENKFVCAIIVGGKILREYNGTVILPFGAEYEILLKNLNSRRAMVSVTVDGQDATNGRLVLNPNTSVSLERFIKSLTSGNRFKFIERTARIEAHRGIGSDDGLIRAEFWYEKEPVRQVTPYRPPPNFYKQRGSIRPSGMASRSMGPTRSSGGFRSFTGGITGQSVGGSDVDSFAYNAVQDSATMPGSEVHANVNYAETSFTSDIGITVPGSESHQQFYNVPSFPVEPTSSVIILQLRGEMQGVPVEDPITVQYKPVCSTCGRNNKATSKFCTECGTALLVI